MKRASTRLLAALAVWALIGILTIGTAGAVEEHHDPEAQAQTTETSGKRLDAMGPDTVQGSGPGPGMMGMMGSPDDQSGPGMVGSDVKGPGMTGPDMMGNSMMGTGMMGSGMMRMMMTHMMGGPGGVGKMMGGMGGMDGRGGPDSMARMGHMLERLDLTPEQWNQVRTVARERLEKMVDLWAQWMKPQIQLDSLRWDESVDAARVKDLFARRAEAQAEMFLAGLDYLQELKTILGPEQRARLEGMGF